jgi:hypothetical protein
LYDKRRLVDKNVAIKAYPRQSQTETASRRVGGFIEDQSDSDPDSLFVGSSGRQQSKFPALPEAKVKKSFALQHPAPTPSTPPATQAQHRPSTGGKQLNKEALEAYIESLRDDISSTSEKEEEIAPPEAVRIVREESPVCEADQYHWAYQVWRRSWTNGFDSDEAEWFVCGSKAVYTSLDAANTAAGQEILYVRDGLATNPYARYWSRTLDEHDMAHFEVQLDNGCIQIKVARFLRNRRSGQLPTSKAGWLSKTGWDIMRKTTLRVPKVVNDCFGEATHQTFDVQVEVEVIDGIYTIMDEANREAGDLILNLYGKKDDPKLDVQIKRSTEQKRLHELLDALETTDEPFHESFVNNDGAIIEIYVQWRELKGPRNI